MLVGLSLGNTLHAQIASGTVVVQPTSIPGASYSAPPLPQGPGSTLQYTTNNNCEMISTISATSDLGVVTAQVTVDPAAFLFNGQPLAGRYYEIHPSMNAQQSATVTLYFSQADFDAYNILAASLGSSSYPAINVSGTPNLKVTVFHGQASEGTSGPKGQYDNTRKEVLTPTSVMLNNAGFYEVTFTTPGFSGFFVHTLNGTPLLITLKDITAQNIGSVNRIDWHTLTEAAGDQFRIERSADGSHFEALATLNALGKAPSTYSYRDEHPFAGVGYYRLALFNGQNGTISYSRIVTATVKEAGFAMHAYPNPVAQHLTVKISGGTDGRLLLTDATGRMVGEATAVNGIATFSVKHLAQGLYLVQYRDSQRSQTLKVYKN